MFTHYTIGVKRRFLPWYKRYKVIRHWCESSDFATDGTQLQFPMRMCLKLTDNSLLVLPNIAARTWRLYPDYEQFMGELAEAKAALEQQKLAEDEA